MRQPGVAGEEAKSELPHTAAEPSCVNVTGQKERHTDVVQNSPYLTTVPDKVHRFWWTCFPALPRSRETHAYHALKRVWFDHTINTFEEAAPGQWRRRARGFYTEGSEDHIAPVLFQNWALFPESSWAPSLLEAYHIGVKGAVRRVRWCPFFEQPYDGRKFCIADIVLCWEDDAGIGLLVLEAKVRGRKLGTKDLPQASRYLRMPSIRAISRRHFGLLVDAADEAVVRRTIMETAPIATWQTLGRLQIAAAQHLPLCSGWVDRITRLLAAHFSYFGFDVDGWASACVGISSDMVATCDQYAEIRAHELPASVEDFLIGSLVVLAARNGNMPASPHDWIYDEPDCISIYCQGRQHKAGYQTTADRRIARWSLDWKP